MKLGDRIGQTAMRLEACRGHRLRPRLREPEVLVAHLRPQRLPRRGVQQRRQPSTGVPRGHRCVRGDGDRPRALEQRVRPGARLRRVLAGGRADARALRRRTPRRVAAPARCCRYNLRGGAGRPELSRDHQPGRGRRLRRGSGARRRAALGTRTTRDVVVGGSRCPRGRVQDDQPARGRHRGAVVPRAGVPAASSGGCRARTTVDAPVLIACAVLVGSAVVVTFVWLAIAGARATVDALDLPSNQAFYFRDFPSNLLLKPENLFAFFPPGGLAYRVTPIQTPVITLITYMTGWLSVAALLARRCGSRSRTGSRRSAASPRSCSWSRHLPSCSRPSWQTMCSSSPRHGTR